ncbi:MAG: DUF3592 domain-containing protein [Gloeomargarita sp. SKYG116]|nr:DUF3592 domain-containing protein [Gloeomargarita sp. SKYG116]MDW8400359.1 DUF3592 domain-containing protein [Gloeomargarita sp. SKYGB_i_bin116]
MSLLTPFVIIGAIIANYIRIICNFGQVLADGVETEAVIVYKSQRRRRSFHRVIYEYQDPTGRVRRNGFDLFRSEYDKYQVGDRIQVVYSASQPHISFTKETVDQARQAQQR